MTETKTRTACCRDCGRRLLVTDLQRDGLGAYFCSPCYTAALELLASIA